MRKKGENNIKPPRGVKLRSARLNNDFTLGCRKSTACRKNGSKDTAALQLVKNRHYTHHGLALGT